MIPRFSDHAANERTYLAWVRTAIAIMAFGFVIERFDLFLAYLGARIDGTAHHVRSAQWVGLALIVVSVLMIVASTVRYLRHRQAISAAGESSYGSPLSDTLLAVLFVCLGGFLVVYVAHQL